MKISKSNKKKILEGIYYFKIDELKLLCGELEISVVGKKQDLINHILSSLNLQDDSINNGKDLKTKLPKRHPKNANSETHIIPGEYTNGKKSRQIFKNLIGEHFSFTIYGMDWIKECWDNHIYPSYKDFAEYWSTEYQRRKAGGSFSGPKTNRRVLFFRENKGLTKDQLEKAWKKERELNVVSVRSIISKSLKK